MADISELSGSSSTKVVGSDSNGAEQDFIGSTDRRMWTESRVIYNDSGKIPFYSSDFIRNGGSASMKVDGSTTPVTFTWSAPDSSVWKIVSLQIIFGGSGDLRSNLFGGRSALTNGLIVEYQTDGTARTLRNLKDNLDVVALFDHHLTVGSSGTKLFADVGGLWFSGLVDFNTNENPSLYIDGSQSDYLRARVRDDLSSEAFLRISVTAYREK